MRIGYVRESANKNQFNKQIKEIFHLNCDKIIIEKLIDGVLSYAALEKGIAEMLPEDQLVVTGLTELGLKLQKIDKLLLKLEEKSVYFISIKENINTTTKEGKNIGQIIHCLSETEKKILHESTVFGIEKAKKVGRVGGRPAISDELVAQIVYQYYSNGRSIREIAQKYDISLGAAHKYIKKFNKQAY